MLALLAAIAAMTLPSRDGASAAGAHGELVPVIPRTNTPRVLDGAVLDTAQVGDKIIVAGDFTTVQPNGQFPLVQSFLMAYDLETGEFDEDFRVVIDRPVNIIEPAADGQSFYIGGLFNNVDGLARRKVAKLDLDGNVISNFKANASAEVLALSLDADDNTLYVGGNFASVAGRERSRIAAVNAITGKVDLSFDYPLSGPIGAGGFMGVKTLDVSEDGNQLLVLSSSRFIGGQPRTALAMFDVSGPDAVLRDWSTNHYEDALVSIGGQLRISDAAISPDGSYFVVVASGGDRPPTNDSAVKFSTAGGAGVTADWVSRHFDSIYSVDVSDTAVYVGGHFQYQEAPGSTNPFPGDPNENYGFGQGLGPAVLGDEVVRREQVGALDPSTGKSMNWSPGANGFHGVTAVRVIERGLLIGHDGTLIGGADIGRHGFFDLDSTATVGGAPETFLTSPRDGEVADTAGTISLAGVATAGDNVEDVLITVQNVKTKQWLNAAGDMQSGYAKASVTLANPGAQSSDWSNTVTLPAGTYRIRAKTVDGNGVRDASAATVKFEMKEFAQVPPETNIVGGAEVVGNTITVGGNASDEQGVASVGISFYNLDSKLWLQSNGTENEQFYSTAAQLTAPNALETDWTHTVSVPDGRWRIVANAVDVGGVGDPSAARFTVTVFPNNELPTVAITSPNATLVEAPGPLTITGTASDDVGVQRVRVLVMNVVTRQGPTQNGFFGNAGWIWIPVDSQGATTSTWSLTIDDLPVGNYRITAYTEDVAGQVTAGPNRAKVVIDKSVPGDERPDTTLAAPARYEQTFTSNDVTISGSASDDNGVARVDVGVYNVIEREWLHSDGLFGNFELVEAILDNAGGPTTNYTLDVTLPNGTYRIYSFAVDAVGQYDPSLSGAYSTSVIHPGDADPTIEMNTPVAGDVFTNTISAGGRAFDDIGVQRVEVLIRKRAVYEGPRKDGTIGTPQWVEAFATNPGGVFTDWSYTSIDLPAGEWFLRARTVDSVGKVLLNYEQALVTVN